MSRSLALRALLVLVVSAGLAGTVAKLTAPAGTARPAGLSPVAEVHSVPAGEAALFAILRRPRTAADAFTAVRAGAGPDGANPSLARSVREPASALSRGLVSVVAARGGVCLRVPVGTRLSQWWCQHTALAARGLLLMASRPPGRLRASNQVIVGLVPDGVRSVVIAAAGGVRRVVDVHDNVYDAQIYAPVSVSIVLPGGKRVRYTAP